MYKLSRYGAALVAPGRLSLQCASCGALAGATSSAAERACTPRAECTPNEHVTSRITVVASGSTSRMDAAALVAESARPQAFKTAPVQLQRRLFAGPPPAPGRNYSIRGNQCPGVQRVRPAGCPRRRRESLPHCAQREKVSREGREGIRDHCCTNLLLAASHAMCPGNACTSATTTHCACRAHAPHTPLSNEMRETAVRP